jgi:hypothetical protein
MDGNAALLPLSSRESSTVCPAFAASIATLRSPVIPVNNATVTGENVVG